MSDAHVKAARLKKVRLADAEDDGCTLYVLIKGEDRRQIDGAVADVLAFEAAKTMAPPEPEPEAVRDRRRAVVGLRLRPETQKPLGRLGWGLIGVGVQVNR